VPAVNERSSTTPRCRALPRRPVSRNRAQ
jgi:hypothetical protein